MISVLLQGQLVNDPKSRTTEAGKAYVTATVRTPTDDDALLCSVIVFDAQAGTRCFNWAKAMRSR